MGTDAIAVYLERINRAVAKGDATEHAFGYIECKDIGVNLKKEEKGEQFLCG